MVLPRFPPSLSLSLSLSFFLFLTKIRPRIFHCGETCRFSCVKHTCAPHIHVCACGWTWMARLPRYRSSSWPPRVMPYPLALHNNLPRRVCSGISARTLPPALLFPLPRPPSLLSLDRCYSRVFRPSFIRLLGPSWTRRCRSSFLTVCSLADLFAYSMYCITFLFMLNWIIYRNEILFEQMYVDVSHFFDGTKLLFFNWKYRKWFWIINFSNWYFINDWNVML